MPEASSNGARAAPSPLRIAFLALNFPPEIGATSTRLDALTKGLAAKGHEVSVITAMPNYPSGRIAKGYRLKLRSREKHGEVLVMRSAIYASRSTRAFPRLLGQTSFAVSSLLQIGRLRKQDVLVIESPPLLLVPAGLVLGRLARAKVVMNVSDIWPDLPQRVGYRLGRLSLAVMRLLERTGYRRSKAVTTTTPGAAANIAGRFEDVQTAIISNGVDLDLFGPEARSQEVRSSLGACPDDFLVGYCGLHGLFQDLELVVEAAVKLRDHPRIKFVLVGDGPTKRRIVQLAEDHVLTNIRFSDAVPSSEIPAILASCDAGVVPLIAELPETIPSKLFEILASGIPAVVTARSEGAALVEHFKTGRTFPPGDRDALVAALEDLADGDYDRAELARSCRNAAGRFDRKAVVAEAERVFRAIADGRPLPLAPFDAWGRLRADPACRAGGSEPEPGGVGPEDRICVG